MQMIFRIIGLIGFPLLALFISTQSAQIGIKVGAWITAFLICLSIIINIIRQQRGRKRSDREREQKEAHYHDMVEKLFLASSGLPASYISGLGDNPELEHLRREAARLEKTYKFMEAITEYEKYLKHPRASIENVIAANILIGNCFARISRFANALTSYKKSLEESKKIEDKKERLRAKAAVLTNLGKVYILIGRVRKAEKIIMAALKIHKNLGLEDGVADNLRNLGHAYQHIGKTDKALPMFEKSLDIETRIGDIQGQASDLLNIGNIYGAAGKIKEALKYFQNALEKYLAINDLGGEAGCYSNIGICLRNSGNIEGALRVSQKALDIYRTLQFENHIADCLSNIGIYLKDLGRLDEALAALKESLEINM